MKRAVIGLLLLCSLSACIHRQTPEERLLENVGKMKDSYLDMLNEALEREQAQMRRR
jgi:hypothetical protein